VVSAPAPDALDPDTLGSEESTRIFFDRIAPDLLTGQPRAEPVVVLVAGPPGAGTSLAGAEVLADLGRSAAVLIDADDFRPYHPRHEAYALADDRTAIARTCRTVQRWVSMAIDHVITQRVDAVVSTSFGDPAAARALIDRFRGAGYPVQVAYVGTDESRCRLDVLARYQEGRDAVGYGPFVPGTELRAAFDGLPEVAALIDELRLVDVVHVYARTGELLYGNDLDPAGDWSVPPKTRGALEAARAAAWPPAEVHRFRATAAALGPVLPEDLRDALRRTLALAAPQLTTAPDRRTDTAAQPDPPADLPGRLRVAPGHAEAPAAVAAPPASGPRPGPTAR
jgi:predicted ABC-type ATPase